MCPGFLSPQKTLVTVASEERRHWEAKCKSGVVRLRIKGREIVIGIITKYDKVNCYFVAAFEHAFREW